MKKNWTIAAGLLIALSASQAGAVEILTNGGFETGDFSGWTGTTGINSSCDTDWNVSAVGGAAATNCQPGVFGGTYPGAPIEGSFAAYNSFDGDGPKEFRLTQSIVVPTSVASATLSWMETYNVDLTAGATVLREFVVEITDATDTVSLGIIDSQTIGVLASQVEIDWTLFSVDIGALLAANAGDTVNVVFRNVIPESFSGPGGFGLDDVSLDVTTVPAPATLALFGLGFAGIGYQRRKQAKAV